MCATFTGETQDQLTESKQLTELLTSEIVDQTVCVQRVPTADPFEDKTPKAILEREYRLASHTLATTDQVIINPVFELLDTFDVLTRYLSMFRYFRAGVKLVLQFVTSPMQYGQVMVSLLPYTDSTTDWMRDSQQSQANATVLDITEQNSIELTLPYLRPSLYFRNEGDDKAWRVVVNVLFLGTVTTDVPATFTMNVFASFVDMEAAGYVPGATFQSKGGSMWSSVAAPALLSAAAFGWGSEKSFDFSIKDESTVDQATDNVRLDVLGDISDPTVHRTKTRVKLGDCKRIVNTYTPGPDNVTNLSLICMRPTLVSTHVFSATEDVVQISGNPLQASTYASYLMRMFRFFRGGVKVMLKFSMSTLVSGRVQISLFSAGRADLVADAFGDVKSWCLTLRGSQEWSVHIPYLQDRAWSEPDSANYIEPVLTVSLVDSLPQPFDKPCSIFMSVFIAADSQFKMTGLQSCVPKFQSLRDKFIAIKELNPTDAFPYQGGIDEGYEILGRFSSRDGDPANHFPFPLKVQDWEDLYTKDNYDYFCNLYKFYTGANHIKMLFSSAPADGLLQATIGNTRGSATGDTFKAGNGVVATHQTVWPSLDFTFPYMCEDPFNSVWEPVGMYPQIIDEEAVVSKYLISLSDDFRLFFLLPLPDFFFGEEAEFQSSQMARSLTFFDVLNVGFTIPDDSLEVSADIGYDIRNVTVDVSVVRTAGTDDGFFCLFLSDAPVTVIPTGSEVPLYGVMLLHWADVTNSGTNVFSFSQNFCFGTPVAEAGGLPLVVSVVTDEAGGSDFDVRIGITSQPLSGVSGLGLYVYGQQVFLPVNPVVEIGLPVSVLQSGVTPFLCSVVNTVDVTSSTPLDVHVTNEPLEVEFETPIDVHVTNDPLPVSLPGAITITQPITIQGVLQGVPVRVTGY